MKNGTRKGILESSQINECQCMIAVKQGTFYVWTIRRGTENKTTALYKSRVRLHLAYYVQ